MSNVVSALFFLWSRSALNVVRARLRRLKQPKYFIGGLIAIAYFGFIFIGPVMARRERMAQRDPADASLSPETFATIITSTAAVFLAFAIVTMWLWRRGRTALQFSEAEIAFLFPGPVAHGALVHYSLMRTQLAIMLSALFISLMTLSWPIPSPWWMRFVGWWLLLSVFSLHLTASGFVFARLRNRGITQWQRQLLALGVCVLTLVLFNVLDRDLRLPMQNEMAPPERFAAYAQGQIGDGPLYWLLAPLRAVAGPLVAADVPAFLLALLPALTVIAAHYIWAFVSEVPDAEASLAKAQKMAALRDAMRSGKLGVRLEPLKARREPFRLRSQGSPVIALLWKNLLSTREYLNIRTALVIAAVMIAFDLWLGTRADPGFVQALPPMLAMILGSQVLILGAQFARQDLRSDLDNADLIKTWPMEGWQVVLGELLAPTVILTGMLWLCLLQIGLSAESPEQAWLTPQLRLVAGISIGLILPFLCAVQLLIANTAVVLFPAWMKSAPGQQNAGVEVMGQRMLFMFGQWLAMLVALLPGLLLGVLVYIPFAWFVDSFAMLPAAIVTVLVLAAELAWGISWLGERFDDYDLTTS